MKSRGKFAQTDEATPYDAEHALESGAGHELAIAAFLRDLALAIRILSAFIEKNVTMGVEAPSVGREEDHEATLRQFEESVEARASTGIATYLDEAASAVQKIAAAMDPRSQSRDWRLQMYRRGRGRRPDKDRLIKNSKSQIALEKKMRIYGKKEAALAAISKTARGKPIPGSSRATVFRRTSKRKTSRPTE